MSDLRERVPGHSLVDELLRQWDLGTIHVDPTSNGIVIDEEAVSWYRGVIGERRVADLLSHLGNAWTVLHSVPVGRGSSDIDHIVIGQAGVFTINTKYSPGKKVWVAGYGIYVGGHQQHYVRNSMGEARTASDRLSRAAGMTVPVTSLLVFVDPSDLTLKAPAGGEVNDPELHVLRDRELLAAFATRPMFSVEQVERIVEKAVLAETWHDSPAPSTSGRHISREFEALEAAVGPRLAEPVARPAAPKPVRAPHPTTPARPPGRARTQVRRKPRQSPLEKLVRGLVMPIAGFAVAWALLTYFTQR